jgi:hypothetical protein
VERRERIAGMTGWSGAGSAAARLAEQRRLDAIGNLARKMKAAGLWLARAQLSDFVRAQKTCGQNLERRLVVPLLDPADHAYLTSLNVGTIFAPRPRIRMPLITAFGYGMGVAFHSYLHVGEDDRERSGQLCALFNLFIALFDRVCDAPEAGFASLVAILDEPMLRRLANDSDALDELKRAAAGAESPELRAVLAIFVAFHRQTQDFAGVWRAAPCWFRFNEALIEAYRAEIATVSRQRRDMPVRDLRAAAQRKSVLPFQIMLAVTQLGGKDAPRANVLNAEALARHVGTAFSLTDDLVDLSRDDRSGDVNTILLSEMLDPSHDVPGAGHGSNRIAAGGHLDEAADTIVANLAASIKLAESSASAMDRSRFRDILIGSTQNWLGAADRHLAETTAIA